jgi:hypothetical protein
MTLKSPFEDLSQTTLRSLAGGMKKLEYLGELRKLRGEYWHWGFSKVHGDSAAKKTFHEAHRAAISEVLCTPLGTLLSDAESSSRNSGIDPEQYLESLGKKQEELIPTNPGAGSARHLSSVLHALLGLEKSRRLNAIPPAALPPPPLVRSPRHPADIAESRAKPERADEAGE